MPRTVTGTTDITISKCIEDIDCEFHLRVGYAITPAVPMTWCRSTGSFDPPEPPVCEVTHCDCLAVEFHPGGNAYKIGIADAKERSHIGDFVQGCWENEIVDACFEDANDQEGGE